MDQLNQLKVKGLVLGPFHAVQKDQANSLNLEMILRNHGTKEELEAVLLKAKKKGSLFYSFKSSKLKMFSDFYLVWCFSVSFVRYFCGC